MKELGPSGPVVVADHDGVRWGRDGLHEPRWHAWIELLMEGEEVKARADGDAFYTEETHDSSRCGARRHMRDAQL